MSPYTVHAYWFEQLKPSDWFDPHEGLDNEIRDKFLVLMEQAKACELYEWRSDPEDALAEIIVLDQLSRNIYRGTPQAYAQDNLALELAQEAIEKGYDKGLSPHKLQFLYMPFMHSESKLIHERAMKLFEAVGDAALLEDEKKHKEIIDRFGRYPHRNEILGRQSTSEEEEFLKQPNSSCYLKRRRSGSVGSRYLYMA